MSLSDTDVEAAKALIARGEPPLAIRKYFPSFRDAVSFYASVRATQFGIGTAPDRCCACQSAAGGVVSEFQWTALFSRFSISFIHIILLFVGHFGIPVKTEVVGFSTFHGFCPACWRKSRKLRWARGFLEAASIILALAGILAALGCGLAPIWLDHLSTTDKVELFVACACGVLAIVIAIVIRLRSRLLGTPPSLRNIAPRPFQLHATLLMQAIEVPGDAAHRIVHVPKYRKEGPPSMSWQATVAVLVIVFVGFPGVLIAIMPDLSASSHQIGWGMIASCVCIVALLTFLHLRRHKQIRDAYYRQMAAQIAAG